MICSELGQTMKLFTHQNFAMVMDQRRQGKIMFCEKKCAFFLALVFTILFFVLLTSYDINHRDELNLLSKVGRPLDRLFLIFADGYWSANTQAALLGILGLVQYAFIGYVAGLAACSKTK